MSYQQAKAPDEITDLARKVLALLDGLSVTDVRKCVWRCRHLSVCCITDLL